MTEKSPFSNLDHIGVIVSDMHKAVEYFQSLGFGPFKAPNVIHTERKLRGKLVTADSCKNEVTLGQMGQVRLQLIQPGSGEESVAKKFFETKGSGIHHLAFSVDDIDKERNKLAEKGLTAFFSSRFSNGGGASYFDASNFGVVLELVQWPAV